MAEWSTRHNHRPEDMEAVKGLTLDAIHVIWNAANAVSEDTCWACEAKPSIRPNGLCPDCVDLPDRKVLLMAKNNQRLRLGLPLIEGDVYHLDKNGWLESGTRGVVADNPGHITFRCPCDLREVTVTSPPHTITLEDYGGKLLLTLDGSVGMEAQGQLPTNWCHFHIKQGVPAMCGDAQCPGLKDA